MTGLRDEVAGPDRRGGRGRHTELLVLVGLVVLAAATRLPGLELRGQWDADQGHDMTVLHALVTSGQVPLLGPPTSIGTFHHGALYYYLLAPAAFLSGADPGAVVLEIALIGIAAVAATWWLARVVGGPVAAVVAGLVAAVSPAAIEESTFIWNPNLVPLFAALAFGGAIRGRQTGRSRWWVLAGLAASVAVQAHVLDIALVIPLAGLWLDTLVRRRRAGGPVLATVRGGIAAMALVALGFIPLLVSELSTGFVETRAILAFLAGTGGGGDPAATALPIRLAVVGLRIITWPVAGLMTEHPAASSLAVLVVAVLISAAVVRRRAARGTRAAAVAATADAGAEADADARACADARAGAVDMAAARFLAVALVLSAVVLAVVAPSLASVVPGLPNDHYHAFLDPVVLALAGAGVARVAAVLRGAGDNARRVSAARLTTSMVTLAIVALAITTWPPATSPDGGWPGADAAAQRVLRVTGDAPVALDGLPTFKRPDALGFPLLRRGAQLVADGSDGAATVLVCDPLFEAVAGDPCGGPAEDAWLGETARANLVLVDRWEAGSRRVISVYAPESP